MQGSYSWSPAELCRHGLLERLFYFLFSSYSEAHPSRLGSPDPGMVRSHFAKLPGDIFQCHRTDLVASQGNHSVEFPTRYHMECFHAESRSQNTITSRRRAAAQQVTQYRNTAFDIDKPFKLCRHLVGDTSEANGVRRVLDTPFDNHLSPCRFGSFANNYNREVFAQRTAQS